MNVFCEFEKRYKSNTDISNEDLNKIFDIAERDAISGKMNKGTIKMDIISRLRGFLK